jgi:hypothetical protein
MQKRLRFLCSKSTKAVVGETQTDETPLFAHVGVTRDHFQGREWSEIPYGAGYAPGSAAAPFQSRLELTTYLFEAWLTLAARNDGQFDAISDVRKNRIS